MKKKKPNPAAHLIKAARKERRAQASRRNLAKARDAKGQKQVVLGVGGAVEPSKRSLIHDQARLELLAALRLRPIPAAACQAVGVSYSSFHHHYRTDAAFATLVDEAKIEGWESLEAATFSEAMKPSEPGVNTGKLKEFLLKGRKRHVYGDRLSVQSEHRHSVVIDLVPALPAPRAQDVLVVDSEFEELTGPPESEEP